MGAAATVTNGTAIVRANRQTARSWCRVDSASNSANSKWNAAKATLPALSWAAARATSARTSEGRMWSPDSWIARSALAKCISRMTRRASARGWRLKQRVEQATYIAASSGVLGKTDRRAIAADADSRNKNPRKVRLFPERPLRYSPQLPGEVAIRGTP